MHSAEEFIISKIYSQQYPIFAPYVDNSDSSGPYHAKQ